MTTITNLFQTPHETIVQFLSSQLSQQDLPLSFSQDELRSLVEVPPDAALGDYAFPCFKLSKALRKAPPLIAQELAVAFQKNPDQIPAEVLTIKAVGPYVNFLLDYTRLAGPVLQSILDKSLFEKGRKTKLARTMIEFSQPNTHKAFHVGHCRNVALGDALVRMNRYVGYDVIAANYIGDDGAHIAKCLWYYKNFNKELPPATHRGEWLGGFYTAATQKFEDASPEEKVEYQKQISQVQQKLESKDPEMHALWLETKEWSMQDFKEIYQWLDVHFDHYFYESEVLEESRKIVADGLNSGTFIRSEGAVGIDLANDQLPFFLLLKSDGTTLYSTRDLALARRKFEDFKVERSVYVVASEQELHFRQVFKTLEKMGFQQVKNCFHLSYGLVVLPEGKMSSRVGNVIYFSKLRDLLVNHVLNVVFKQIDTSDWSEEEKVDTAKKVAIAAIKYGMIASDPKKQIVFDMDQWLSFTGDTGPYLLYSYVRIQSILRKAGFKPTPGVAISKPEIFNGADEKAMLKRLINFNGTVARAVQANSPAVLAGFLFEFCQEFNSFYTKTPILKQEDEELRRSYLVLLSAVAQTMAQGCSLLGLSMPERM